MVSRHQHDVLRVRKYRQRAKSFPASNVDFRRTPDSTFAVFLKEQRQTGAMRKNTRETEQKKRGDSSELGHVLRERTSWGAHCGVAMERSLQAIWSWSTLLWSCVFYELHLCHGFWVGFLFSLFLQLLQTTQSQLAFLALGRTHSAHIHFAHTHTYTHTHTHSLQTTTITYTHPRWQSFGCNEYNNVRWPCMPEYKRATKTGARNNTTRQLPQ
mmetsp:Transcript_5818/g.12935  ORF Transcript_5818/g.12935 Transcript_5818/m.12935 type:complete len:213 (-) Transcript_5818:1874-2512(-)